MQLQSVLPGRRRAELRPRARRHPPLISLENILLESVRRGRLRHCRGRGPAPPAVNKLATRNGDRDGAVHEPGAGRRAEGPRRAERPVRPRLRALRDAGRSAPFTGPTVESIVHQHLMATPPPITQLRPAITADVAAALQRALAKTPADRFNPVAQFASALRSPTGAATAPVAASAPRSSRAILVGGAVVALAAIAFMLLRSRGSAAAALPVIGRTTQVTRANGLEVDPALSPDGENVAYAAGRPPRCRSTSRRSAAGARRPDERHHQQLPLASLVARRIADRISVQ